MPETAERPDLSIGLWGNNFVASVQNSQDGSSMPFSALRTDARDFFSRPKSPKSLCEACRAKNALLPPKPIAYYIIKSFSSQRRQGKRILIQPRLNFRHEIGGYQPVVRASNFFRKTMTENHPSAPYRRPKAT